MVHYANHDDTEESRETNTERVIMNTRVFTVEEARALLPAVTEIVDELRNLRVRITENRRRIDILETLWGDDVRRDDNPDAEEYRRHKLDNRSLVRRFRQQSEHLDELGCHVKDLDHGDVGFFHVRNGLAVFMAWNIGRVEREWHEEIAPNARVFSLDEARALLPHLRKVFAEFDALNEGLVDARKELQRLRTIGNDESFDHPDREKTQELNDRISRLLERGRTLEQILHDYGCQLRDFQEGLIDFFHVRDGQLVVLCWRRDESDITAWHPFDAGYTARKPLDNGESPNTIPTGQ